MVKLEQLCNSRFNEFASFFLFLLKSVKLMAIFVHKLHNYLLLVRISHRVQKTEVFLCRVQLSCDSHDHEITNQ